MNEELLIPLERIPDEGLDVNIELKPEILNIEDKKWPPCSGAKLTGRLERVGDREAVFRGRAIGEFEVECCLGMALFRLPVDEPTIAYFQAPPSYGEGNSESDWEVGKKDLEVYYLEESDIVDLMNPLRDQLLLAIPLQPKCLYKCLGEDPEKCRRLKEGEGVGTEENLDPRWASLKDWGGAEG